MVEHQPLQVFTNHVSIRKLVKHKEDNNKL